ncbi:MAG: YfdQ family protein, partial [Acidobacteria bacterium]|nr:YfdQ family protein [Acidobacteriota bacterium]
RTTPEWDTWFAKNQKAFGQVEFAEFLEDNLIDVAEPTGADLLEITRTLEAKKDVAYSSAIKLNNGSVRINYDEVIKGTANTQAGVIEIPEQFTLQIQVIRGGSQFRFPARFKYRLKDRALLLWYEIVRPHKILEQALDETVAAIREGTGIPIRKGVATLTK